MNSRRPPLLDRLAGGLLALVLLTAAAFYLDFARRHAPVVDEAVFGRASLAILDGDWTLSHWRVMKPPAVYFAQAIARGVLGPSAFAGRIPGVLAGLACLWLLYCIGRRWFGRWTGLLAAALLALSPFALYHLPTGRADALALCFTMLAAELSGRRKFVWAGAAFSLAFLTRQHVVLSLPVIYGLGLLAMQRADDRRPWLRRGWRLTWKFFKGSLPALAALLIWSLFEKIPFAWLVNEFQGRKYREGGHLARSFGEKLDHWLGAGGVSDFFGWPPLLAAAVAGAALGVYWLTRPAGDQAAAERRQTGVVAVLLASFIALFLLLHSLRFFTLYLRFLAPIVPWAALLAAWPLVEAVRRARAWRRAAGQAALALLIAAPLALSLRGQWVYAASLHAPWPEDDVPAAVQWIERHARPGAVLFTRKLGPEVEYAAWRTSVRSQQLVEKTGRFGQIAVERLGADLFLFLSPTDERDWLAAVQASLPEGFELQLVREAPLRVSRLYRLTAPAAVGVVDGQFVYWQEGGLTRAPLSCELIGRLLQEALAKSPDAAGGIGFVWQVCDPTPAPGALAWQAGGFPVGPLNVARAAFYYERPELDWEALAASRRLAIHSTAAGRAEFLIRGEELAAYIQKKNRNLRHVRVAVVGDELRIYADARLFGRTTPVVLAGRIGLAGKRLLFDPRAAAIGGTAAPDFLLSYAAKVMNPVFEIDLLAWALAPVETAVMPAPDNGVVLIAGGVTR